MQLTGEAEAFDVLQDSVTYTGDIVIADRGFYESFRFEGCDQPGSPPA